jgi:riboflavin transporter FmnP
MTNDGTVARKQHWQTRQLATMALLLALGELLSFLEFPIIPGFDFLKLDASHVVAMVGGLTYGPGAGCLVGVLIAFVHAMFTGNIWGAVMNAVVVCAFVLPASLIYRKTKSNGIFILGLVISGICSIAAAILMNLLVTPIYTGWPIDAVIEIIIPALLPFNIIKALVNCILSFIMLKTLGVFIK